MDQLAGLVDEPNETLSTEYKSWLDLNSNDHRADLARHIAALANYGGGYIVFGFSDDMSIAPRDPNFSAMVTRDIVSGISQKYLEPPVQCDVRVVRSAAGNDHPVVIVPPHGATPVCAKSGGPEIKGTAAAIVKGAYYIRKIGPQSGPIQTPEEWRPLIRRCAMHERSAILAALSSVLSTSGTDPTRKDDALRQWHDSAHAAYLKRYAEDAPPAHWQYSYVIKTEDSETLPPNEFLWTLREVNAEVRDRVESGWSMFFIFDAPGSTEWEIDTSSGEGERDFVQIALERDKTFMPDEFWRVSPSGKATIIRPYLEDGSFFLDRYKRAPGTTIDPEILAQDLTEFVRHGQAVAERFSVPTSVEFRCEWFGTAGRDPLVMPDYGRRAGRATSVDHKVASGSWPLVTVVGEWPKVVSELAAPLARSMGMERFFTPEGISNLIKRRRR
jgi:hypothetical protein